jgi:hypothetical protein
MVGVPKILLSWTKQRSGGPQGNVFTKRIVHAPGTWFLEVSEPGPNTRILTNQETEREPRLTAQQREGAHQGRTKEINQWWASNGSTLALRRFPVSKSGDGGTSLGSGVPAKQLKSQ